MPCTCGRSSPGPARWRRRTPSGVENICAATIYRRSPMRYHVRAEAVARAVAAAEAMARVVVVVAWAVALVAAAVRVVMREYLEAEARVLWLQMTLGC